MRTDKDRYPKVLNVLAGIEFDVRLEDRQEKCHIIAIFDANEKNCDQITQGLNVRKLESVTDVYTRDEFEKIPIYILKKLWEKNIILLQRRRWALFARGAVG